MNAVDAARDRRHQSCWVNFPERRAYARRKAQRFFADIPVTFQYGGQTVQARCLDIGTGGIRIRSPLHVPSGTHLVLQLSFNGSMSFMGFAGSVRCALAIEGNEGSRSCDISIEFTQIGAVEEKVLTACVAELTTVKNGDLNGMSSSLLDKNITIFLTDRPISASQYVKRRVVITGLGVISPLGIGKDAFEEGIRGGCSGVRTVSQFDVTHLPSKLAAQVMGFNPTSYLSPKRIRQMDRCTQMAIAASQLAVNDAGVELEKIESERAGVLVGTSIGGLRWALEQRDSFIPGDYRRINPYSTIAIYPNAVSGQVSIEFGFKGRTDTISSGCTSAGTAFGTAAELIQRGELDLVLAGGTEDPIEQGVYSSLCAAGALSTMNDDPPRSPRPFDAERDGPVLGEGAGVLVFEELDHAMKRGARIYAEFTGFGTSADAFSLSRTNPNGIQAGRALRQAITSAGLTMEEVDYILAYGLGTPSCDWTEARIIKEVFGMRAARIPVSAIQSMVGFPWAALGAFQLTTACIALSRGVIAPTINYSVRDPSCELDVVPNHARQSDVYHAVCNLFGCGKNVVLVTSRFAS